MRVVDVALGLLGELGDSLLGADAALCGVALCIGTDERLTRMQLPVIEIHPGAQQRSGLVLAGRPVQFETGTYVRTYSSHRPKRFSL